MTISDLPREARPAFVAFVDKVRRDYLADLKANGKARGITVHVDEYEGTARLGKGGHVTAWNNGRFRADRLGLGYTGAHVTIVRRRLRQWGISATLDETESLIQQALARNSDREVLVITAADRKRQHRARLRAEGKCTVCANGTLARPGLSTCGPCGERAARIAEERRERIENGFVSTSDRTVREDEDDLDDLLDALE